MTTQLIINEERKRREFLYHVYNSAHGQKYFSIPGGGAYGHVVYEKMERNWALLGSTIYSLLRYHLDEGNISVTTPEARPPDNGLLEAEHWFRYGKIPSPIYITRKGEAAVESNHELLACLVEGGDVDWGRVDTAVLTPNDPVLSPKTEQRSVSVPSEQEKKRQVQWEFRGYTQMWV